MYLVKLLLISFHILNTSAKEEEDDSDIIGIKIQQIHTYHQRWNLELDLGNGKTESIMLSKTPSILNINTKIDECEKAGDCQKMDVGDSEEKCNYAGSFDSDPDSIVSIVGCDGENQDLVLVSSKKKFKGATYRKNAKTGKVTYLKQTQNTTVPISLGKEKQPVNSINNEKGEKCCEIKKARNCTIVTKGNKNKDLNVCNIYPKTVCGQMCQQENVRKADYGETMIKFKGGNDEDQDNCCITIKTVCGPPSKNYVYFPLEPETEETCKTVLGDRVLCGPICEKAENQDKKNNKVTIQEKSKSLKSEIPVKDITEALTEVRKIENKAEEPHKSPKLNTSQKHTDDDITTKEPDTIEKTDTPEEPRTSEKSETIKESVNPEKNKYIEDAKLKDLEKLEKKDQTKDDKSKKNGSEKYTYERKTLEFGVTLDPEVYEDAKKKLGADHNEIRKQLMKNIQHTLLTAQSFLQHKSISKTGGFSIIINGIKILKDWGAQTELAKEQNGLKAALEVWKNYVEKINTGSDADEFYHDINLLFTGKKNGEDLSEYSYKGFACVNCICNKNAQLIFFYPLTKTGESPEGLGRLLAHEIGHILGASHDEDTPDQNASVFKDKSKVPCPLGSLMSANVKSDYQEFSSCSQADIDNDPDNKKQTCLFK